ncbi:FG-GAP-like repeat-containing protein [Tautonia sociabilis]|nr:FG-GAP-like repeat-containing protein [Tautonia sociabilis]
MTRRRLPAASTSRPNALKSRHRKNRETRRGRPTLEALEARIVMAGEFTDVTVGLPSVDLSSVAWGDYDNDGDLDLFLAGSGSSNIRYSRVYRNDTATANTAPTAPTNLQSVDNGDGTITFSWDAATDSQTASSGLSYVLVIGSTSGGLDVVSPMSDPSAGARRIAFRGTIQGTSFTFDISGLADGYSCWSVQAVDTGLAGESFGSEQTFLVSELTYEESTVDIVHVQRAAVAWGDYDGDGDLDLVISGQDENQQGVSQVYRNDGSGNFTLVDLALEGLTRSSATWADTDGDGDLDLLLIGLDDSQSGTARLYRNVVRLPV